MQRTFAEAVVVFSQLASQHARDIAARKSELNRQPPPAQLMSLIQQLFGADALKELDRLAPNEYWFVTLAGTAVAALIHVGGDEQINPQTVRAAAELLKSFVANEFLERINSARWNELADGELASAKEKGIIVTDETWPFEDRDRINPIFCV